MAVRTTLLVLPLQSHLSSKITSPSAKHMKKNTVESLLEHQFSEPDLLWLEAAAKGINFDPRSARVELRQKIPTDYDPQKIDIRFYRDHKLTLIGIRRFNPNAPLLKNIESVALEIQSRLLQLPVTDAIDLAQMAKTIKLTEPEIQEAVLALSELIPFFSGVTHEALYQPAKVWFTGPHGYDVPLKFTTLDNALEQRFRDMADMGRAGLLHLQLGNSTVQKTAEDAIEPSGVSLVATQIKKNYAFVIMPIDPERPELVDVLATIKDVAARFEITARRADEIEHQDVITKVILNEIKTCEYLIADLSHERPNVYYEVGYAHAHDKKPILFRRQNTKLHFDLSVHNVPEYKNMTDLRELLTRRFEAILGRSASS